jgi:GntR family negative regulator for fad regulon and positive regulator of fabA
MTLPAFAPAPLRPIEHAEQALIQAMLDGAFPPGSTLPGERELAGLLGITRPTLREALARLERDGWLTVRQGKSTRVNDFRAEGGLNVLTALVHHSRELPPDFIDNLLEVRLALAPAYICRAVECDRQAVIELLGEAGRLEDTPQTYAAFDWKLHHRLTILSGNPVYTLILNGFAGFYEEMARIYFANPDARAASQLFYAGLAGAAVADDPQAAVRISTAAMQASIQYWDLSREATDRPSGGEL